MRRGRERLLDDDDDDNTTLRFVYAIPHNKPSAAAAAAEQLAQIDVMGADATASLVFEDDLMSSPDPLNDSITDSALVKSTGPRPPTGALSPLRQMQQPPSTRRITRSALGQLASSSAKPYSNLASATSARSSALNSPKKQTFELDVGSEISPQRILVTVETEDSMRDMDSVMMNKDPRLSPGKKRVSRRLFRSPSRPLTATSTSGDIARTASLRRTRTLRRGEVVTTTVPLRGLTDDEGDGEGEGGNGAAIASEATPRKRGRPPKSGTPALSTAGRKKTPIRKTPGRLLRQAKPLHGSDALTSDISLGDSQTSATPRPTGSKPGRPPKRKLDSSPGKHGGVRGPSPRKRGRPRKNAVEPGLSEEPAPAHDEQEPVADAESEVSNNVSMVSAPIDERVSVVGSESSAVSGPQPDDDVAMDQGHESEDDIWLANLSAPPTPAVGRGWKKLSSPAAQLPVASSSAADTTTSNVPSDELRRFSAAPSTEPVLASGAAESQFETDHGDHGDHHDYAASHTSETQSQTGDQNPGFAARSEREDTAAGEDFTEISISMLPSMNPGSSIRVPDAEDEEFGEATNLIINRTLEELRRSQMETEAADESAGSAEQQAANTQPDLEDASSVQQGLSREGQDQQQLPVADQSSMIDSRDSKVAQPKSQHSWWSSPRRGKVRTSLGKQLALKNLKAKEDVPARAGEAPSEPGNEESQDTNMYEDSFSEIPEAVLEAATPRPSYQRSEVTTKQDEREEEVEPEQEGDNLEDVQPMSDVRSSLGSGKPPSPASRRLTVDTQPNPPSQANSLLTPDETPSVDSEANNTHERDTTAIIKGRISINIMPSAPTNTSTGLPTSGPAFEEAMGSSPPAFNTGFLQPGGRHSNSVFRHSRTRSMETPLDQSLSPAPGGSPAAMSTLENDKNRVLHTAPPFHNELPTQPRPGLSPIVRAGRALQLVTSDPPSPQGRESVLGSPFGGSSHSPGRSPLVASFLPWQALQKNEPRTAAILGTTGSLTSTAAGSFAPAQPPPSRTRSRSRSRSQSREPSLKSPARQQPERVRVDSLGPPQRDLASPRHSQKDISPDPIAIASAAFHSDDVFAPRPGTDGSRSGRDSTFRISGVFADGRLSVPERPQAISGDGPSLSTGLAEEDHSEEDITSPPLKEHHPGLAPENTEMDIDEGADGGDNGQVDGDGDAGENASEDMNGVYEHEAQEQQHEVSEDEDDIWAVEAARFILTATDVDKAKEPAVAALPSRRPKLPSPWRPASKGPQRAGNVRRLLLKHSEPEEFSLLSQAGDGLDSNGKYSVARQRVNPTGKNVDISAFFSSPATLPDVDQPGFGLLSKALGQRTENIPPKEQEQPQQERQHQPGGLPEQPRTFTVPWSAGTGRETDPLSTDPAATIDDPTSPLQDMVNISSGFQSQKVRFPARRDSGQASIPEKNFRIEQDNRCRPKGADLFSPARRPQEQSLSTVGAVAAPTPSIERNNRDNLQELSSPTAAAYPQQGVFPSLAQKRDFNPRARRGPNTLFGTGLSSFPHAATGIIDNHSDDHLPPSATKPPVLFNPTHSIQAYPVQLRENAFFEDSSPAAAAAAAATTINGRHENDDYSAYEDEEYEEDEEDVEMPDSEEQQPERDEQPSSEPRPAPRLIPGRAASPAKSCLRSPLKPKTPGRVVEFASTVLSPAEQARLRAERRRSRSRSDSLSSVGSNPGSTRHGEDADRASANNASKVNRGVSFEPEEQADDGAITSGSRTWGTLAAGGAGGKEQESRGGVRETKEIAVRAETRREAEPRRQPQEQAPGKTGGGFFGMLSSLAPTALTNPFSSAKSATGSPAAPSPVNPMLASKSASASTAASSSTASKPAAVAKAARASSSSNKNTALDQTASQDVPIHPPNPPRPSARRAAPEWTRAHWLKLDELLQARRQGPVHFQKLLQTYTRRYASVAAAAPSAPLSSSALASSGLSSLFRLGRTSLEPQTSFFTDANSIAARLIGRTLSAQGRSMVLERWHLEVVAAFRALLLLASMLGESGGGNAGAGGGASGGGLGRKEADENAGAESGGERANEDARRWRAWDDEDVARRLFALMVGEERRRLGLVPKRRVG